MRRRICWLLFYSVSTLLLNAQGNSPKAVDITITVWMKNPMGKEIIVDIDPISLSPKSNVRNQKRMVLDDNNKGVLKIPLEGPSIIKFMMAYKDSSVSYVALPGTDIVFHFDALGGDTINYNDTGPKENYYYNHILTKSQELLKAIPQQDPQLYVRKWAEEYDVMQKLIASAKASGMSLGYIDWMSQSIQSLFQSELCRQFVTYVTITRRWPLNTDEYTARISSFTTGQFSQPGLFTRETDKEFVESYYLFYSLTQDKKKQLPAPDAETNYRNAIGYAKKIAAEGPRNIMLRYLVTTATAHTTDTSFLSWMKNTIVFDKHTGHLLKMINDKKMLLRNIGKDRAAPYFEATDISGNKFSYKNYEGKYLFIDIWATWCVPCRKEMPYLEQLKQKYAGQPIEFISVSVDNNIGAWKKFIGSTEYKDQFHSMPDKAAGVRAVYGADLIPVFVLIDPRGKIINPTSFRPSDPALDLLLNELLQKNKAQTIQ